MIPIQLAPNLKVAVHGIKSKSGIAVQHNHNSRELMRIAHGSLWGPVTAVMDAFRLESARGA